MADYFTGDNVPKKFKITDALGDVEPSAVSVVIVKPRKELTEPADATIDGNTVSYLVPRGVNDRGGDYHMFFVCSLPYGERTYQMNYTILENPR